MAVVKIAWNSAKAAMEEGRDKVCRGYINDSLGFMGYIRPKNELEC